MTAEGPEGSPRNKRPIIAVVAAVMIVLGLLGARLAIRAGTAVVKANEMSLKEFKLQREELWRHAQSGGPQVLDLNGYVQVDDTATRLFSPLFKCPTDHFLAFKENEDDSSRDGILICPVADGARRADVVKAYADRWGRAHVKILLKTDKAALMTSTPIVDVFALDLEWK